MGAGKWRETYTATLRVADVCIIADKDEAGALTHRLSSASFMAWQNPSAYWNCRPPTASR